jgi:hypothetical protein
MGVSGAAGRVFLELVCCQLYAFCLLETKIYPSFFEFLGRWAGLVGS